MKTILTAICAGFYTSLLFLVILYSPANAATITSVSGGSFNDPDIWDSGEVPTSADSVVMLGEHSITLTSNQTVTSICVYNNIPDEQALFTINAGTTLIVTGYFRIHSDGAAEDEEPTARVNLKGTLKVSKDFYLTSYDGVFNTAVATLKFLYVNGTLELGGTFVNEGGGGFVDASTAVTTLRLNGSSSKTLDVSGDIEFYNITIDKTGGATVTLAGENLNTGNFLGHFSIDNGKFNNGGFTITGNNTKNFTVKNGTTLALNGTSLPVGYTVALNSGSTVEYQGTATVSSTTYHNVVISGSGTKTLGGAITINGNITLTGGTLDVNNSNNYAIAVKGNWVNLGGTFQARNGTVTFSGTSDQAVTSNSNNFYNLVINNTGTQVSLNDNLPINNVLTMTDALITTSASYRVILNSTSAAALTGYSSGSFVNGNLRRSIASNTSVYTFPVGNGTSGTNYYRVDLTNGNLTGITYIDVRFKALANHSDSEMNVQDNWGNGSLTYTTINTAGVWEITPNASPSGGSYQVKLYTTNMSGLTNNNFGPLKRPNGSVTGAAWSTGGGTLSNNNGDGRLVAHGYAIRKGLTGFSEFGVGAGASSGGGLPIKLLSFEAVEQEGRVELKWSTGTEVNNDFFTIERARDGVEFEVMNTFQGSGNSSVTLNYRATDHYPYTGISYYRLKQTDFDGAFTYSDAVSVLIQSETSITLLSNPVINKTVTLKIKGEQEEGFSKPFITLDELNGKNIFTKTNIDPASDGVCSIALPSYLKPGIYVFTYHHGKTTFRSKLFVE